MRRGDTHFLSPFRGLVGKVCGVCESDFAHLYQSKSGCYAAVWSSVWKCAKQARTLTPKAILKCAECVASIEATPHTQSRVIILILILVGKGQSIPSSIFEGVFYCVSSLSLRWYQQLGRRHLVKRYPMRLWPNVRLRTVDLQGSLIACRIRTLQSPCCR